MVTLGLCHYCVPEAGNLFLEFHRLIDGETFWLRMSPTQTSPVPDLDDSDDEFGTFELIQLR